MSNEQKQTSCKSSIWREVGRTWAETDTVLVSLFSLYLRRSAGGLFTIKAFVTLSSGHSCRLHHVFENTFYFFQSKLLIPKTAVTSQQLETQDKNPAFHKHSKVPDFGSAIMSSEIEIIL